MSNFSFLLRFAALLLIGLPTLPVGAQSSPPALSNAARISLMTVAPGEELYSTFGHSAVRVQDETLHFDRIYNYGTFDFSQPNFYLNFCRGKLLYSLDREPYRAFERENVADRRSIREQVLNLTPAQRDRLFKLLETNALPENRDYKYDFFYDNCATRIRDIVRDAVVAPISFDSSKLTQGATMRQLLRPYLHYHPWTQFGIDLVLGAPTDRVAHIEQAMFLPDRLHDAFAGAHLTDGGQPLQSVEFCKPEFQFEHTRPQNNPLTDPFWVMCAVAALGLLCHLNERALRIFDTIFWFVLGLAGLIIFLLWFFTDHSATKNNLNIFWALPTHLFFFWQRTARSSLAQNYFAVTSIVAAIVLSIWTFLPQELPTPALPIVTLVVLKGLMRLRR